MKNHRTKIWIPMVVLTLTLVACGGGGAEETAADAEAPAESPGGASQQASGGGVTCKQMGVANHIASFSRCGDDVVRVLFCKQAAGGYQCDCKQGPMTEEETFKTEMITEGKPFEFTLSDIQVLHGNATAAAREICGFEIEHPCDGSS